MSYFDKVKFHPHNVCGSVWYVPANYTALNLVGLGSYGQVW